jgi:hypothetical protein
VQHLFLWTWDKSWGFACLLLKMEKDYDRDYDPYFEIANILENLEMKIHERRLDTKTGSIKPLKPNC